MGKQKQVGLPDDLIQTVHAKSFQQSDGELEKFLSVNWARKLTNDVDGATANNSFPLSADTPFGSIVRRTLGPE